MKRILKLIVLLMLFIYPRNLFTKIQFIKAYGTDVIERARGLIQMNNGKYIIVGEKADSAEAQHHLLISETDRFGNLLLTRKFYDPSVTYNSAYYRAWSVVPTSDNGFVVGGYIVDSSLNNSDFMVAKFNSSLSLSWVKAIGGYDRDMGVSLIQTDDAGYLIIGHTWSFGAGLNDFLLVKLTSQGSLEWAKTIGGGSNEIGMAVIQTSDGGYAALGNTHTFGAGGSDFLLVKIDSSGNLEWAKTIGGTDDEAPEYTSLIQTQDRGYVITGYTKSFGAGVSDILIAKFDSSGNLEWAKAAGGGDMERVQYLVQTYDKGFLITGYTQSFGSGYNPLLVKFDSSGSYEWFRIVNSEGYSFGYSLLQSVDGGYTVGGSTSSFGPGYLPNIILIKFDSSGNSCITQDVNPSVTTINPVVTSPVPNIISVFPSVRSINFVVDTISLIDTTVCEYIEIQEEQGLSGKMPEILYYSSIFNDKIRIDFSSSSNNPLKIELYDVKGTPVYEKSYEYTPQILIIDEKGIKSLKSGIYFLDILTGEKKSKMVKIIKP